MQKKTCRFCLAPVVVYYSLLESNRLNVLETLTALKITDDDNFTKYSCIKCWLNIKLAYQIQQSILEADKKLRDNANVTIEIKQESVTVSEHTDISLATLKNEILEDRTFESFHNNCPICSESTDSMIRHLKTHFFKRSCNQCHINFEDMLSYRNHCNNFHNDMSLKMLVCGECNLSFSYISSYNTHVERAHKNDSSLVINDNNNGKLEEKKEAVQITANNKIRKILRKIYPISRSEAIKKKPLVKTKRLVKRRITNHSATSNGDSFISKTFLKCQQPPDTSADTGVLMYDNEGNIKCPDCPKTFQKKRQFSAHKVYHLKKQCSVCKLEISAVNFSRHVEMHRSGSVVCHICGAVAKNIGSLRGHLYYTHSTRQYPCEHCGKIFKKQYIRDLHVKKEHTGEKEHICDTCGKSFFTLHCLTKHINMTHLKLRPFICSYCEKGFCSKHALRTHIRQHTNEAPYICSVCGEGFRQNVSLKAHKKSKHKIVEKKEFACKVCHKMFVDAWAVKSHMRLHL